MSRKLKTTAFNLSYSNALSFNIGDLVPIYLEDVVPGDHFKITPDFYVKFAPMVFPILQRIEAKIKYFFVPNRIIFKRWEKFITGGKNGTDVINPPFINAYNVPEKYRGDGTLLDYLGYPDFPSGGQSRSAPDYNALLPFLYQLVWNEYFRDETLSHDFRDVFMHAPDSPDDETEVDAADFANHINDYPAQEVFQDELFTIRKVAWKKDYFTTASPWAQRGAEVHIPNNLNPFDVVDIDSSDSQLHDATFTESGSGDSLSLYGKYDASDDQPLGTLNQFYQASALQRFLQKAILGSRYIEQIANFFHVRVPDYRLNRPEYIGGLSKVVQISEILQTSESTSESALGTYAGKGAVGGVGKTLDFRVKEHGWIIGIMFIRPDASYFQGIRRNLFREDRFDYFWPQFQGIGQQPILKKELFAERDNGDTNDQVWGYQDRYSEYKFHNNEIHGDFRSSMDSWTMARKFLGVPGLTAYFTQVDSDATGNNRVFVVPSAKSTLYGVVNNNVIAYRPRLENDPYHSI